MGNGPSISVVLDVPLNQHSPLRTLLESKPLLGEGSHRNLAIAQCSR